MNFGFEKISVTRGIKTRPSEPLSQQQCIKQAQREEGREGVEMSDENIKLISEYMLLCEQKNYECIVE
jgi:hypothetical protein